MPAMRANSRYVVCATIVNLHPAAEIWGARGQFQPSARLCNNVENTMLSLIITPDSCLVA